MRNFKSWPPGKGAKHSLMTGAPMQKPLNRVSAAAGGTRMEPVQGLATGQGDVQAALSTGGFGKLKRAGRP